MVWGAAVVSLLGVFGLAVAGVAAAFLFSPLDPLAFAPGTPREAERTVTAAARPVTGSLAYPEAVAVAPDGTVIAGLSSGRLLHVRPEEDALSSRVGQGTADHTAAQAIGLAPDPRDGTLWSASFPSGLQNMPMAAQALPHEVVADAVDGVALGFADDVAVGAEGLVYVTDASTRFNPRTTSPGTPYVLYDLLEGRPHGRLLIHDPTTGETRTAYSGLYFPSGVAITPDGATLLVVETARYRLLAFPLLKGEPEMPRVLADNLPGIPDDVFIGPRGGIWVTLAAPRDALMDGWLHPHPWLARLVASLPDALLRPLETPVAGGGGVLKVGADGRLLCQVPLPDGMPPANGTAWRDQLLLGRLGDGPLVSVDPAVCDG